MKGRFVVFSISIKSVGRTGKCLKFAVKQLAWQGTPSTLFTCSLHGKAGATPGCLDQHEFMEEQGCGQCSSTFCWYLAPTMALQNIKLLGSISRIPKTSLKCSEGLAGQCPFLHGRTISFPLKVKCNLFRLRGSAVTEWVFRTR